jgi:hypothetical protein
MKIEWQPEDIVAGRVVGKPDRNERWMIGYKSTAADDVRWCLVSLTDGMIHPALSKDALALHLNGCGEMPSEFLDSPQARGGRARAASMSKAERIEQARNAANVRWNGVNVTD